MPIHGPEQAQKILPIASRASISPTLSLLHTPLLPPEPATERYQKNPIHFVRALNETEIASFMRPRFVAWREKRRCLYSPTIINALASLTRWKLHRWLYLWREHYV
jgi:hypothetical protein